MHMRVRANLTACTFVRKPILWREWSLELPSYRLALGHLLLGTLDWMTASAVLFVLLPTETLSLPHVMLKPFMPATEALGALIIFQGYTWSSSTSEMAA